MLVLFLCLVPFLAATFGTPAGAEERRDVRAIVQAVEARYRSARTLKAIFLERYSESRWDIRLESGTAYFSRPGRMRWEYEAPEKKLFLVDGKNAWFYVPTDRTATRASLKESADWRSPLALLAGKAKLSRFCARVELGSGPLLGPGHLVLRCVPRGPRMHSSAGESALPSSRGNGVEEILLEVEERHNRLARILIRERGGVELEFRFGNWQENVSLPESLFHFQPPPGVAIVDESLAAGSLR